jgi:hypothetical protein
MCLFRMYDWLVVSLLVSLLASFFCLVVGFNLVWNLVGYVLLFFVGQVSLTLPIF